MVVAVAKAKERR